MAYSLSGSFKLSDGRTIVIEVDERYNVRTTLIVDEPCPPGVSVFAWEGGLETRGAMTREQWNRTQELERKTKE